MTVTLAQLLEESPKLEVVRRDESVAVAMDRMIEHGYSQLPVVEDGDPLRAIGLISTGTIAQAAFTLAAAPGELRVDHAIDEHPIKKRMGDELWRALDAARAGEVLLVEDADGILRGILTGHDFTTYLRRQSEASLTVHDIEHTLKQLISDHYRERDDALREAVQRELGVHHRSLKKDVHKIVSTYLSDVAGARVQPDREVFESSFERHRPDTNSYEFDRLSFNQYQQIFVSPECWASYADAIGLPVKRLDALLTIARNLRNQIMHNRGLPSPAERVKLIYCRDLLNRVADRRNQPANAVAIDLLRGEAQALGDFETARLCAEALDGDAEALDAVCRTLQDAEDADDDDELDDYSADDRD